MPSCKNCGVPASTGHSHCEGEASKRETIMLDEKRIQEIKERAEKATGEKWMALPIVLSDRCNGIVLAFEHTHTLDQECWDADDCPGQDKAYIVETDGGFYGPTWDDAQFMAEAREDIPFLLKTIEDLRGEQGGWIAAEYERGRKAGLQQAADYFKDVGHTTLASDLEKLPAPPGCGCQEK